MRGHSSNQNSTVWAPIKLDKRTIDNRANLSIINNRLSITIIIELGPWQYYRATTGPL
jgi:hypothetical protein